MRYLWTLCLLHCFSVILLFQGYFLLGGLIKCYYRKTQTKINNNIKFNSKLYWADKTCEVYAFLNSFYNKKDFSLKVWDCILSFIGELLIPKGHSWVKTRFPSPFLFYRATFISRKDCNQYMCWESSFERKLKVIFRRNA